MKSKSQKNQNEIVTPKQITVEQKAALVDALLACRTVIDRDVRQMVVELLPTEVSTKIRRHDVDKIDVTSIVSACLEHGYPSSFELLLNAVFVYEGNSDAWRNLNELWSRIRPPERTGLSSLQDVQPVVHGMYSRVGEHICIDRRWECTTFVHMKARDGKISQKILAFQVPGSRGKSLLLKRFAYMCKMDATEGKPILYARTDFRDRLLTPYSLIHELLIGMLENASIIEHKLPDLIEKQLRDLIQRVQQLSVEKVQKTISQTELLELASDVFVAFRKIPHEWMIVWMLDTFEDSGSAGDWLLNYFIPKIVAMDNVILVLAGRTGLSALESRPDEVIFRSTLEPIKYSDDCQRWAELKYGLKISEEMASRIIRQYDGDLQQIDMVLKVMRDFPDLVADMNSTIEGGAE